MLRGIDTSHHSVLTANIFNQMAWDNTLFFNFLKATEGATVQDNKFVSYWQMSRDAGLLCGAYHFLRPLADPAAQARNFLSQYKKVSRNGVLPPVVDIEWAYLNNKDQWAQITAKQRVERIKTFLFLIEQDLSLKPIIYTAVSFWRDMIQPQLSGDDSQYFAAHPLWIVDLKGTGQLPAIWQRSAFVQTHFGEAATTPALYDRLDQDGFNGSLRELLNTTVGGLTMAKGFPKSMIVKELQTALKTKQWLDDTADGIFGGHTETAVKKFQVANGLLDTGIIDMQTWNKLLV